MANCCATGRKQSSKGTKKEKFSLHYEALRRKDSEHRDNQASKAGKDCAMNGSFYYIELTALAMVTLPIR